MLGSMLPNCFISLCLLAAQLSTVVEGKKYGLPDPVRRYAFVDPIQRPSRTSTSITLGTPNPNAPIYSSDFSSTGYFQPATDPQYIRNATCTWVTPKYVSSNISTMAVPAKTPAVYNLCLDTQRL